MAIPQIRVRVELQRGDGAKAIEELRSTEAYGFGYITVGIPAYLRGLAYLQIKPGPQAVAEFQKYLDHKTAFGPSRTCPGFNSVWRVGMLCRATLQRLALPIRTF